MRNREAARYARWAATAAGVIVLVVAGVYVRRTVRQSRTRHLAPAAVPTTVEQRQAEFSFSKVQQERTIFTIRASHATQFKDQDRALLEEVWITVYGHKGTGDDNIHTHECNYAPTAGAVRCEGEVDIDLSGADTSAGKSPGKTLLVKTSDVSFNRDSGEASTTAPVEFSFSQGKGRGVGATYSSRDSTIRIQRGVVFDLAPTASAGGMPINITASSLEIHRDEKLVVLDGPSVVRQGSRELAAGKISIELDDDYHARHAVAEGQPMIRAAEDKGKFTLSANRFESVFSPSGWAESLTGEGNVAGTRRTPDGTDRFSAGRVVVAMRPEHNLAKEMTVSDGVTTESHQGDTAHFLKTDALQITFGTGRSSGEQRLENAEALSPATIETKSASETMTLNAKKLLAHFGASGRIESLTAQSGVEIRRQSGSAPAQLGSATGLEATFRQDGEWATLDEKGNVSFRQDDRQATAEHARIVHSTEVVTLDGSPVLSDSMSRTVAGSVTIHQTSGEFQAAGGVVSTYVPPKQGEGVRLGSGAAHISSDSLAGKSGGEAIYSGHSRLWQGDSVLEADQIELSRDDKTLQATGHVVAAFPQGSSPFAIPLKKTPGPSSGGQITWEVRAPLLTFWNDQGKAHLEGGVAASSRDGSLESQTLDVFLTSEQPSSEPGGGSNASPKPNAATTMGPGSRQVSRVVAQGGVVVRQGDRRGTGEQAEYTPEDGKFVLSGGQPTLTNALSDTTTGHSLTFYVANDTILVDSQEGSRTLTKHRVAK